MTMTLLTPTVQVLAFAVGCSLIHVGRRHANMITTALTVVATLLAILLLVAASIALSPDAGTQPDTDMILENAL